MSQGMSAGNGPVQLKDGNGVVYPADSTQPSQIVGNTAAATTDTGNPVKIGGKYSASPPTYTDGQRGDARIDKTGVLFTHIYGDDGAGGVQVIRAASAAQRGNSFLGALFANCFSLIHNGASLDALTKANASSRIASSAASVNATSAKASAGEVYRAIGNNTKAAVIYLKIYNKASAPTVGTDTPVLTIPIPASAPFNIDIGGANGFYLGTGIAYGFTTDAADNGTTALGSGDILGFNLTYS